MKNKKIIVVYLPFWKCNYRNRPYSLQCLFSQFIHTRIQITCVVDKSTLWHKERTLEGLRLGIFAYVANWMSIPPHLKLQLVIPSFNWQVSEKTSFNSIFFSFLRFSSLLFISLLFSLFVFSSLLFPSLLSFFPFPFSFQQHLTSF